MVGAQFAHATLSIDKPVTLLLGRVNLTLFGNPGISLGSSGIHIQGSGSNVSQLTQGFVDSDIMSNVIGGYCPSGTTEATHILNLEVDHLKFQGIPGPVSACPNNGVDILDGSTISVHNNVFTGLREEGARALNSRNVVFQRNLAYGISDGFRFTGVVGGQMLNNTLRDSQLPHSMFQGCFAVDSVNGTGFPNSSSLLIANNMTINMVNCQSFLFHDGQNVVISGNVMQNSGMGISLGTYARPDVISRIVVQGNTFQGTCVNASQPSNTGININNNPAPLLGSHIVVTGNQISNANCGLKADNMAGIVINYASDVSVTKNTIANSYGNGVLLAVGVTGLVLQNNNIVNTLPSADALSAGIRELAGGSASGTVSNDTIQNAAIGMRFDDASSPGLMVGSITTKNVTIPLYMATSASAAILP
ncbi:MAG TPA: right-handed parallel beta-helix repeat-containing protein [Terriglobia bacterium]|nr:right-handed parallel beta-helix repeat-containing protein [Terriglobia bacterium]